MARSQVRRGCPGRRLQSLGNPRIDVSTRIDTALDVSCESPIRATCPKKRSRLVWMNQRRTMPQSDRAGYFTVLQARIVTRIIQDR